VSIEMGTKRMMEMMSLLIAMEAKLQYVVPTGRVIATISIKVPTGRLKSSCDEGRAIGKWLRLGSKE
ncbi:hypothetical protein Tco_1271820, partial [Tanacetum coccineum]